MGDPRVALLFLIPGCGNTLRVNGRARLSIEPALLDAFAVEDKPPRSIAVIAVDAVYFQCARAIVRSELWNPDRHVDPKSLPYIDGTELDFVREGLNEGFKFHNPREKDRCGCGESFRV